VETAAADPLEFAAFGLVVASVLSCIAAHRPHPSAARVAGPI